MRAGDAGDFLEAGVDRGPEEPQVAGCLAVGDGVQSLLARGVRGVDEGAERGGGLAGPDRVRVLLGSVSEVAKEMGFMPISA